MESIGLWPYEKPERRIVRGMCVSFVLTQSVLVQVSVIVASCSIIPVGMTAVT